MNKRVAEIELNINAVRVNQVEKATQGDTNTHFLHLTFANGIELEGYNLQVTYMPPYPETVPYVDVYTDLKQELDILIPNVLLRRTGKVKVDFALSKGEEILTVNKSFTFEVIRTINGSTVTAYPEGELKLTLAQQIEQIAEMTKNAQEILDEYNTNAENKTTAFNNNAATKTQEFDKKVQQETEGLSVTVNKYIEENKEELKGDAGKSAYQIALDEGFVGSEEEWLESLKGKDGKDGADGQNGADGVDGEDAQISSVTATVDDTSGTPQVVVELGGTTTNRTITFKFTGLKGANGANGQNGQDGTDGKNGADGVGIQSIDFKETTEEGNIYTITLTNQNTYDITVPKGDVGPEGPAGQSAFTADGKIISPKGWEIWVD